MNIKRERELSIESGILIATKAHRGQVDKGGNPYILHPLRVMFALAPPAALLNVTPYKQGDFMLAAVLHDVVEDSEWTLEQLLEARTPLIVIEALDHLTRRKESNESYHDYIERLIHNPIARIVKVHDLLDNLQVLRLRPAELKTNISLLEREYRTLLKVCGIVTPEQLTAQLGEARAEAKKERRVQRVQAGQ